MFQEKLFWVLPNWNTGMDTLYWAPYYLHSLSSQVTDASYMLLVLEHRGNITFTVSFLLFNRATKRNAHMTSHRKVISEHILQSKVMSAYSHLVKISGMFCALYGINFASSGSNVLVWGVIYHSPFRKVMKKSARGKGPVCLVPRIRN